MVSPERTRIQKGKAQVHAAENQNQNLNRGLIEDLR